MTQYYKNETGKACAELIRAMDRFSAGSQDTLEVMLDLRMERLGAICDAHLEGKALMDAVHDVWRTVEEDRVLRKRLSQLEQLRRSLSLVQNG